MLNELEVCKAFTSSTIGHLQCNRRKSNREAVPVQAQFQWSWENLQGSAFGMAKQATKVLIVE